MPSRFIQTLSACFLRIIAIAAICLFITHALQAAPLTVTPSVQGRRIALVIGNDAYQKVSKLQKAGNDATAMARELRAAGFEVLLHRDLNYRGMVKAVETLSNSITGGDQVVVFFAGHGVQIKTGSYLLPVDIEATSESEVEKTAYGLADLTDKLSEAKASFALVMVDACRNNPLTSKGRSLGNSRGLSAIEPPKGQMVVYSASKGQEALDRLSESDNNPNGIFTREFIAKMKRPGVRIEDLMREVQDSVEELARTVSHDQRPALYNESRGNFYFFGPTSVQVTPPSSETTAHARARTKEEIEDGYWDGIKDSRDSNAFDSYLKDYPKGRYAGQARVTLTKLKAVTIKPVISTVAPALVPAQAEDIRHQELARATKPQANQLTADPAQLPKNKPKLFGRYIDLAGMVPGSNAVAFRGDQSLAREIINRLPKPISLTALKPAFYSDGLFSQALLGDISKIKALGLAGTLNSIYLFELSPVKMITHRDLQGLTQAMVEVHLTIIDIEKGQISVSETFDLEGKGFSPQRAQADLRLDIESKLQNYAM